MESEQERREEHPADATAGHDDAAASGNAAGDVHVDVDVDVDGGPVRDGALEAIADAHAEALAGSLLWRIGHAYEDGPVTVRVGLASSAPLFADLPRLRAATDQEVEAAIHEGDVQVEWVGPRLGGRS